MKKTWRDWIVEALRDLGGKASYDNLYARLRIIRPGPLTRGWQATVRGTVERNSSDSDNFREGMPDLFYSVGGKGSGYWGLRPR